MQQYILYAIGETFLVVIGILIALQVNNWNVNRLNQNTETQLLAHLNDEYQKNLNELEKRNNFRNIVMNSASWLIRAKDNGELGKNIDSLNFHMAMSLIVATFDPVRGVTDEIINSGKLELLQNEELRIGLSNWLSISGDLVNEEKFYSDFTYKQYLPFLLKNYPVRPLINILQTDNEIEAFLELERPKFYIGSAEINPDHVDFLSNNLEFENFLANIMGWNNLLRDATDNVILHNQELLKLIR
jgi:hypothetical protein